MESDLHLDVLVFELNGTLAGIDSGQISEICDADDAGEKVKRIIKPPGTGGAAVKNRSKVILFRTRDEKTGLLAGMPEEIISVTPSIVRPLPPLFDFFSETIPVWGVVVFKERIILLIDIEKYAAIISDDACS